MARPPIVRLDRVTKDYREAEEPRHVLREASAGLAEGEIVAIRGRSGSGKSTLLNLIAGIDQADRGELMVAGENIELLDESALADWRARNVGFIFQFYNLMPVLTALENVELPLLLTPLSRRERRDRASIALGLVGQS